MLCGNFKRRLISCVICGHSEAEHLRVIIKRLETEREELREVLDHVRADLVEIRDTEPDRRYSPSITILANTGIAACDRALKRS